MKINHSTQTHSNALFSSIRTKHFNITLIIGCFLVPQQACARVQQMLDQLKWREVIPSRSLRNPYVAKFDDAVTGECQGTKDLFLQPPKLIDGI